MGGPNTVERREFQSNFAASTSLAESLDGQGNRLLPKFRSRWNRVGRFEVTISVTRNVVQIAVMEEAFSSGNRHLRTYGAPIDENFLIEMNPLGAGRSPDCPVPRASQGF